MAQHYTVTSELKFTHKCTFLSAGDVISSTQQVHLCINFSSDVTVLISFNTELKPNRTWQSMLAISIKTSDQNAQYLQLVLCQFIDFNKLPVPTQQLTALRTKERSSLALNRYLIATCTLVNQKK